MAGGGEATLGWCDCLVRLQGAIVVCCGLGWLGEWPWCHCRVPLWCEMWGERGTTNFGGVDVVPLLGAIAGCQSLFHIFLLYSGPPFSPRHQRKQQ